MFYQLMYGCKNSINIVKNQNRIKPNGILHIYSTTFRELDMGSTPIIRMEGKRTGIINPAHPTRPDLIGENKYPSIA